jgi:MFS family permease
MILVSGLGCALLLCVNALCTQLWHFYALALLRGVAVAFCSVLPASMLINKWFPEKRAVMTSVVMIGSSVGGLFFTQVCSFLLSNFNWRRAYVVLGLLDAVLFVIAALLIRPEPPVEETTAGTVQAAAKAEETEGVMLQDALKMPAFWFMILGFLLGGFASMGFQGCIATALQLDYGYTVSEAANCYSVFVFTAIFGKLLMGWIFDKFGVVKGLIYQCVLLELALLFMLLAQNHTFGVLLAVAFGLGNMIGTVTSTTVPPAIFGLKDYSKIYGFLTMFITASMGLGTTLSSVIYDASGSFRSAWLLYIVFDLLCAVLLIVALVSMRNRKRSVA